MISRIPSLTITLSKSMLIAGASCVLGFCFGLLGLGLRSNFFGSAESAEGFASATTSEASADVSGISVSITDSIIGASSSSGKSKVLVLFNGISWCCLLSLPDLEVRSRLRGLSPASFTSDSLASFTELSLTSGVSVFSRILVMRSCLRKVSVSSTPRV